MDIMVLIYLSVFIIGVVFNVLIGGWIGSTKGRTGMGQLLGFLAGPLGWLIVAILPEGIKQSTVTIRKTSASRGNLCPMCSRLVPQGRSTCPSCNTPLFKTAQ